MFSRIDLSPNFDKYLKKSPDKVVRSFAIRYVLFEKDPYNRRLRNHALKGKLAGFRSINVTGDWRALYTVKNDGKGGQIAVFETLGTHSQLYG